MNEIERTNQDLPSKKPSLNSVLAHKKREAEQKKRIDALSSYADPKAGYTETEKKMMDEAKSMSVIAHLEELRRRIIICIVAILIATAICYYYVDVIFQVLVAPAGKLYYMRPTEAFFTYMKVAFFAGFLVSSPIVLYHAWAFIIPALTKGEKKITNWLIPVAVFLFFFGILFSYYFVLPAAIKFFIGFATDELQPLFSVGQYLSFIISFLLPFGMVFELPLLAIILSKTGLITSNILIRYRKIMVLMAFVVGGAISPTPDVFSQIMIALPMIVLYEFSIVVIKYGMKK